MKKYLKHILTAFICFLFILILNFALPRLLPGSPIGYLTGFEEEGMSKEKYEFYYHALHLDENIFKQFLYYLKSIFDGTLGYSYKKEEVVATLIKSVLSNSLQIMLPATIISLSLGLILGLRFGYKKDKLGDKLSTTLFIIQNTMPSFMIGLCLIILFCFKNRWFPYVGITSGSYLKGTFAYFKDKIYHLVLPITTLVLATFPARYLLVRNMAAKFSDDKSILYAKERGLNDITIRWKYLFLNIIYPFITMCGLSIGTCIGGSIVVENIFSINGVGSLLNQAIYTLDYPLMQGILFITTTSMIIMVILSDLICIILDPKIRKEAN